MVQAPTINIDSHQTRKLKKKHSLSLPNALLTHRILFTDVIQTSENICCTQHVLLRLLCLQKASGKVSHAHLCINIR